MIMRGKSKVHGAKLVPVLGYLFQHEWGWNRASEFRGQRLASWIVAHPSAVQEFHRLSYETRKFICMQNKFTDHNNIEYLFSTFR
jgi:hypothetical protein